MNRPDFKETARCINSLQELDRLLQSLFAGTRKLEEAARAGCAAKMREQASQKLKEIPVEELKNSKAGIRTQMLQEAGVLSLFDVSRLSEDELRSLKGIGEKQAGAAKRITNEFLDRLTEREHFQIDPDDSVLLLLLAKYRQADLICRDAKKSCSDLHAFLERTIPSVKIRGRIHWMLARTRTREETVEAIRSLLAYEKGEQAARAGRFAALYEDAMRMNEADARKDYEKNSASYYAMAERLTGAEGGGELIYSSIPAKLAEEIRKTEPDLSSFRGDLRAYQHFGVQYILHQERVLLGDEMGLGKTIQAIAVMAHLYAGDPKSHFLVICPASVMINWCREIRRFSEVEPFLLHGSTLESSFDAWREGSGAAVTNYESLRRITDRIDEIISMALLVIDEAHYIKNPDAQRTKLLRRLEDDAQRILLMTGTPLENKVNEMCELIGFVRPDMTDSIRSYAGMRNVSAFREMLSPVYLRRQVQQVLEELPPLLENEEWCSMTVQDHEAYVSQLQAGSFNGMRRVSFLQEDVTTSAKAMRLAELCAQAGWEGKKVVIYSWFRETIRRVSDLMQEVCVGTITGETQIRERQELIDRFSDAPEGSVLICQIQAGGTGLNIQTASVVIFCEPQIKPSLTRQAIARVHRMGQIRAVLVYHLLCEDTIDEAITVLLRKKQEEFDLYAKESAMADAAENLADSEWIRETIEQQRQKYLPALRDE